MCVFTLFVDNIVIDVQKWLKNPKIIVPNKRLKNIKPRLYLKQKRVTVLSTIMQ